ncbi:hypothetical protein Tco_1541279 [Tanacetum coccineum]
MRNIKMTMSKMQLNSKFVNNMLPEWGRFVTAVKLNRGLRDSNYDQLYAYLKQHKAHANENKMLLDRFTQHTVDPLALMSNNRGQGNNAWGAGATGYGGAQNSVENINPGQARQIKCYNCNGIGHIARNYTQPKRPQNSEYIKDKILLMQAQENGVELDEEQLLFLAGGQDNAVDEDVDEQPVQDLALNVDNVFQANDCDAFDSDVDKAPTAQTMFMTNLSSADPVCDEAGPSYDLDILFEYVKDNAMPIVQSNVSPIPNDAYMMILNDMHEQPAQYVFVTIHNNVVDKSLTAKLATYKEQVELYERRAKFELTEREQKIDEQLGIVITDRNIKEENLKKELHSVKMQLTSTINHNKSMVEEALTKEVKETKENFKELEAEVDQNAVHRKHDEIERKNLLIANDNLIVDCFFTEIYDAHTSLKARCLELEVELSDLRDKIQKDNHDELIKRFSNLKISQLNETRSEADRTRDFKTLDFQITQLTKKSMNNKEVHLVYLKHLKERVETLREIIEEAKVERPLDSSLASACCYTKHSQELLEYVISTCTKALNTRDNKHSSTSLPKKKQVTFEEQCAMSKSNTHKPVKQLNYQKTNVPVPPSTGVNSYTDASRSQPRSNTKKNRILSAKSVNMKKVEENPRTIKSSLKTTNRVDSSISFKRTCPLTRLTKPDVVPAKQTENVSTSKSMITKKLSHTSQKPLTIYQRKNQQFQAVPVSLPTSPENQATDASMPSAITYANQQEPDQNWGSNFPNSPSSSVFKCRLYKLSFWYLDSGYSKHMMGDRSRLRNFIKKFIGTVRFGNDHFGAIMGYGDYVIGDSVISKVYYVEGLGHNMFFVRKFYDSDLEVALRKHSCYV